MHLEDILLLLLMYSSDESYLFLDLGGRDGVGC